MPPTIRAFLISSLAEEKLEKVRNTPCMALESTTNVVFSPKKTARTTVAAELGARIDSRKARVVELRFFGGLSVDETRRFSKSLRRL
jgi:hypothetical protein